MKKILKLLFLISIFSLVGCGIKSSDNVLEKIENKLKNANSYYIEGTMEIMNHEDTYTYDVKVSYQKHDYYRIELVNILNNHEQVILRNDDGVYVVTPSLNKSFKFQSDWPYNNSQVYLLNSILEDLLEDEDRDFKTKDNGYVFTSTVNYPNNKSLVKQKVYIDKDNNIKKTEVVDNNENIQIVMEFKKQEFNKKFEKNYFELGNLLKNNNKEEAKTESNITNNQNNETNNNSIDSSNSTTQQENEANNQNQSNQDETNTNTNQTATINDIVYPMYLPDNTYLTSQDSINTENGQRLILTFGGDSSFILVEETINSSNDSIVIPVIGEFDFLADVIGVIGTNSLMWHSNGIEYYMTSDSIPTSELIEIARSISVLPVSK